MTNPGKERPLDASTTYGPLSQFSQQVASLLGAGWSAASRRSTYATGPRGWDPAEKRSWDRAEGVLWRALRRAEDGERAVLTHPHGFQLYLMERPGRPRQVLVGGLLPAGINSYGVTEGPAAICVPRDSVRAAAVMRHRRFLWHYRVAAARVSRETRFGEVNSVVFGRDLDGTPLINVLSQHAARLLLQHGSPWLLDPESGLCRPRIPAGECENLVGSAATLLRAYGYAITLTSAHPWEYAFRPPTKPVPPPAPVLPPGRTAGPTR